MGIVRRENGDILLAIKKHWDELIDHGEVVCYRPGQYIFYENHQALGAYLLCAGKIQLSKSGCPEFQKELSEDSQPIIGMDYLVTGDSYEYSAKAVTEAKLCYLAKSELLKLLPTKRNSTAS